MPVHIKTNRRPMTACLLYFEEWFLEEQTIKSQIDSNAFEDRSWKQRSLRNVFTAAVRSFTTAARNWSGASGAARPSWLPGLKVKLPAGKRQKRKMSLSGKSLPRQKRKNRRRTTVCFLRSPVLALWTRHREKHWNYSKS